MTENSEAREALFWAKVDKSTGCWLWTAHTRPDGYGRFWTGKRLAAAHRYAYTLSRGVIPKGLQLDHLCRNRACVNPDHLEPVTPDENRARGLLSYAIRTTCRRGLHDITRPESWYVRPSGQRTCRECKRLDAAVLSERRADCPGCGRTFSAKYLESGRHPCPTRRLAEQHLGGVA